MLGLPASVRGCLFDLDGVLTSTARLHAAAWAELFDGYLQTRADETGTVFTPFDVEADYIRYVDGRPRADGIRSFLASRNIVLAERAEGENAAVTVAALAERKNAIFDRILHQQGVVVYPDALAFVTAVRTAHWPIAVVSASANTLAVLRLAGLDEAFDARVDGQVAASRHLAGKPAPDTFLYAAGLLGIPPAELAVFEDALAGVAAGRAGGFRTVVGVNRTGHAAELRANGADIVVSDLMELLDT